MDELFNLNDDPVDIRIGIDNLVAGQFTNKKLKDLVFLFDDEPEIRIPRHKLIKFLKDVSNGSKTR